MIKTAHLSPCEQYRYRLFRQWKDGPCMSALWIMLNPSTADDRIDDPTIRKCIGFSDYYGFGAMEVVNLFAYRATDPKEIIDIAKTGYIERAIGECNKAHIRNALLIADAVICAWGANVKKHHSMQAHAERTLKSLQLSGRRVHCIGITKDSIPRHPLYVPYSAPLIDL